MVSTKEITLLSMQSIFTVDVACKTSSSTQAHTHIVIPMWYENVHLRALGTDDLTVHGLFAQVHVAAFGLVNRDGGHFPHHLTNTRFIKIQF